MPKIKTVQSISKRFTFSNPKKGKERIPKILQRQSGQDHFNARESGTITKRKRREKEIKGTFRKTVITFSEKQ